MRGWRCRPRTRGGAPPCQRTYFADGTSSPHTRGCSARSCTVALRSVVVPAHAGVLLNTVTSATPRTGRPRTRGGAPTVGSTDSASLESSPHTRGCSWSSHASHRRPVVVPAHAGVLRFDASCGERSCRRPRTRGGAPQLKPAIDMTQGSSPHTRGCSDRISRRERHPRVVPAHAGVLPWWTGPISPRRCRPRAHAGVLPEVALVRSTPAVSSPHTRGCSRGGQVPFRHVGVVPAHTRGCSQRWHWSGQPCLLYTSD